MKEFNSYVRRGYEMNFCSKVVDTIIKIDIERALCGKVKVAKKFIRQCEAMKTPSFRKDLAIKEIKKFVRIYETYL